jgi:hypothetical protein
MNSIRPPSMARQPLKFPGLVLGTAPTPTLADVMTKLTQLQQNQAQILKAVQGLQINQIRICVMIENMFEMTSSNPGILPLMRSVCTATCQDIAINDG